VGAAVVGDQLLVFWQREEAVELVFGQLVSTRLQFSILAVAAAVVLCNICPHIYK
jgi:hypothetical protein